MIRAGDLTYPIMLEIQTITADAAGGQVQSWQQIGREFARRRDASDAEKRESGGLQGGIAARFVIRAGADAVRADAHRMRIVTDDGEIFQVEGAKVLDTGPRREFVELTARRTDD